MLRLLSVMLSFVLLTGCGFHLRGEVPLAPPLKHLYIQTSDPYGELARNLEKSLVLSGVTLASSPQDASMILNIQNENTNDQLLSVGNTQQTRQYNLTLTVTFELDNPHGQVIVPSQSIAETQSITIQADQILGGSNEENNLYQQMRRDIIYKIMNRLSSKNVTALVTKKQGFSNNYRQ
jgi:LPS-assembly lipoprotein